jgi:pimeloyl-ACP methyl ester carboxylesterase
MDRVRYVKEGDRFREERKIFVVIEPRFAADSGTLSKEKKELFKNTVNENLIPFAKKVTCKTLLIWGEKDEVVPINEALKIREYIPNATLRVVWTAGHLPHVEKRDKFVKILKEYL